MKTKPKVSVIVPIYGVEKYLRQCVDSILTQTLQEIEIILVNDGSPDKCPQIVDEYAARDHRVVALHQPNGGYGVAVNNGIAAATGEYIGIVESDDWIEPTMYEKLYNNAVQNNSDVVKCSFYTYDSTRHPEEQSIPWKEHQKELFDAPDSAFTLAEFPKIVMSHASIWAALYRADFVKKIQLIETRSASYQDFPFMCEVMSTAKRISVLKECLLYWRQFAEGNSTSSTKGEKLIVMAAQTINSVKILEKNGVLDLCREEMGWHAFRANFDFFMRIPWTFKKQYFDELHKLFVSLAGDRSFRFKYFSPYAKSFVKAVIKNDFNKAVHCLQWNWRAIRRAVFSCKIAYPFSSRRRLRLVLLGLQIAKSRDDVDYRIPCWKRVVLRGGE